MEQVTKTKYTDMAQYKIPVNTSNRAQKSYTKFIIYNQQSSEMKQLPVPSFILTVW